MTISVITVVFNDVGHIGKTIRNVSSQTHRDCIEYIIIDGASSDGTSEVIRDNISKIDRYVCEPDRGIYDAMNKGLRMASGDYVIFMNSGDVFSSDGTVGEILCTIGARRPDVVYGSYRECYGDRFSAVIPARKPGMIWYGPVASHQSTLYRLEFLKKHSLHYDESYKIAADYKFTAQSIKLAKCLSQTDICISDFDVSGVSSTNQNLGLKEANRVRREVFGWGRLRLTALTVVLLSSRYIKKYAYPIYSIIRNK